MNDEERESRLFTLTEAERTRLAVEPILVEAIELRRRLGELEETHEQARNRILLLGGIRVNYEGALKLRGEREQIGVALKSALERIESHGCVVKDLNVGLLDFPALVDNQEVYLCWRLGEDRIRFWHRQDEGFAGRKPLDPRDTGPLNPIQ